MLGSPHTTLKTPTASRGIERDICSRVGIGHTVSCTGTMLSLLAFTPKCLRRRLHRHSDVDGEFR
jgi:hypothetical protein